jgi:TonB family protein
MCILYKLETGLMRMSQKKMIKILVMFLMVTMTSEFSFGQDDEIYEGGLNSLYNLIGKKLKYPLNDMKKGVEGTVLLKFRIRDDHTIDSIVVLNSLSPAIDKEALRVIRLSNGFWRMKEANFYLMQIVFKLSYPGRAEDESINQDIIHQLEEKDYKSAIKNLNEIRRRNPFDFANLDRLIFVYNQIGDIENELRIKMLKEEIAFFEKKKKIIGMTL